MTQRFAAIRVRVEAGERAERAAAEAFDAGACGLEEQEVPGGGWTTLILYAPTRCAAEVRRALTELDGVAEAVGPVEEVAAVDWAEAWRDGLAATVISPRLLVRPSFVLQRARRGQAELVIDPGQAFGTGSHASTRLALELCDGLAGRLQGAALDVGTGTGVLALAALRLGVQRAVAFDLDPLAAAAASANARGNGLAARLDIFCGELDALAPRGFELVLANLLRRELLPLVPELARRVKPGGHAIFSGLLAAEGPEVGRALAEAGLVTVREKTHLDATGDTWLALLTQR